MRESVFVCALLAVCSCGGAPPGVDVSAQFDAAPGMSSTMAVQSRALSAAHDAGDAPDAYVLPSTLIDEDASYPPPSSPTEAAAPGICADGLPCGELPDGAWLPGYGPEAGPPEASPPPPSSSYDAGSIASVTCDVTATDGNLTVQGTPVVIQCGPPGPYDGDVSWVVFGSNGDQCGNGYVPSALCASGTPCTVYSTVYVGTPSQRSTAQTGTCP